MLQLMIHCHLTDTTPVHKVKNGGSKDSEIGQLQGRGAAGSRIICKIVRGIDGPLTTFGAFLDRPTITLCFGVIALLIFYAQSGSHKHYHQQSVPQQGVQRLPF